MITNRSRVGEASKVIGAGGALRLFVLESIFHREAELGARCHEQAQMILGEAVRLTVIKSKHSGAAIAAAQGNGKRRLQRADRRGRTKVKSFGRRIAVADRFLVTCYPAGKTLSHGNAQRAKQVVVHAVNIFGNQHAVLANKENDGAVGNYFLQADTDD